MCSHREWLWKCGWNSHQAVLGTSKYLGRRPPIRYSADWDHANAWQSLRPGHRWHCSRWLGWCLPNWLQSKAWDWTFSGWARGKDKNAYPWILAIDQKHWFRVSIRTHGPPGYSEIIWANNTGIGAAGVGIWGRSPFRAPWKAVDYGTIKLSEHVCLCRANARVRTEWKACGTTQDGKAVQN